MTSRRVASASTARGDVVLNRRADGSLELRVNGVFVMDTTETTTERLLATSTLAEVDGPGPLTALVGGLGLGATLAQVLDDPRVDAVVVAEIEPVLAEWHRRGLVPHSPLGPSTRGSDRVAVELADVRSVVRDLADEAVDVVLLDVDNGPNFLVYADNAAIYQAPFLADCRRVLADGGVLGIWSSDASPPLTRALSDAFGRCDAHPVPVRLGRRDSTYHLFLARRPQSAASAEVVSG